MPSVKETVLFEALPEEQQSWPVLSFSQLSMLERCRYQWYLAYKLEYAKSEQSDALGLGSLVHEGLAEYYRAKQQGRTAEWFQQVRLRGMAEEWFNRHGDRAMPLASHATWLLDRYLNDCEYFDQGHQVIHVEHHFLIPIKSARGRDMLLQGYVDLVTIDSRGRVWIWDHKTGGWWGANEILMHPQIPMYMIALDSVGLESRHQIVNQISGYDYKKPSNVPTEKLFRRDELTRTDTELVSMARGVLEWCDEWLDEREASRPPRRSQDRHNCKYCDFVEPCSLALKGIPVELTLEGDSEFRQKNTPFEVIRTPSEFVIEGYEDEYS